MFNFKRACTKINPIDTEIAGSGGSMLGRKVAGKSAVKSAAPADN